MENTFYNKVVRQGNSLCVRIPLKISKKLNLKKGTIASISLVNIDEESKKLPEELIQAYKTTMKNFSIDEIREFLNYYAIETTTNEKVKANNRYEEFKKLLKNKKNKANIKKKIKKTNYWKRVK
ncbi:MAG: hypothetical protein AABX30_00045 [Nanoarchaeota archaeon]